MSFRQEPYDWNSRFLPNAPADPLFQKKIHFTRFEGSRPNHNTVLPSIVHPDFMISFTLLTGSSYLTLLLIFSSGCHILEYCSPYPFFRQIPSTYLVLLISMLEIYVCRSFFLLFGLWIAERSEHRIYASPLLYFESQDHSPRYSSNCIWSIERG